MTTKGNSNKPRVNMPRPSFMWVYGILGALIIGWALFGQSDDTPLQSDWMTVGQMVEAGEVEKIEVINRDQAQVYLRKEAVKRYRTDTNDKRFRRMPEKGVQLVFNIGSVDSFREDLKAAEQVSGSQVPVVYENKTSDWTNILVNLLPWVLIIGVWFFIMRSMSRGAGGGAGGGIMNVGKAKAQVFDKDNSKRVTFKDVAGLEEAKVEIMEIVDFLKKADKYREQLRIYRMVLRQSLQTEVKACILYSFHLEKEIPKTHDGIPAKDFKRDARPKLFGFCTKIRRTKHQPMAEKGRI